MAGRKRPTPREQPSPEEDVAWIAGCAKQLRVDVDDAVLQGRPSFVNDAIGILRNQANPMLTRAMAARTLGLLMERDASLKRQLKLDSDVLVDALLQIVNHCRHAKKASSMDTRKIHVNCCLVISMLMEAPYPTTSTGLGHLVSLHSELLVLTAPVKLRKRKITADVRPSSPVTSMNQQEDRRTTTTAAAARRPRTVVSRSKPPSRHTPMRSVLFGNEGDVMGLDARGDDLPVYEYDQRFAGYGVPHVYFPFQRPLSNAATSSRAATPSMRPRTLRKPSRAVKGSKLTTALAVTPNIIMPSSLYEGSLPTDRRPFLLPPDHMLEMLATNHMPMSLPFSRESVRRSAESRLRPTPWGDIRPVILDSSFAQHPELQSLVYVPAPKRRLVVRTTEATNDQVDESLDISSAAYKRQRLLAILSCPIDSTSTTAVDALAVAEHATLMRGFSTALHTLRDQEASLRVQMDRRIHLMRNKLPLKFLFELPGGVGYCRDRLQHAMALWLEEFEVNQQRVAWVQWKGLVERSRYHDRMGAFVRQAALKRMRLAMALVVKAFLHKGYVKWVQTTRTDLYMARDVAARRIQPCVRRYFALQRVYKLHDACPVNGALRDMYLAPPRLHLAFCLPLRIRLERRQLWAAAIAVQAPYRGRRFRKFMQRQRRAATRIQALARKRIAEHAYHKVRRHIKRMQAAIRRYLCRSRFLRLRVAALLVQRSWRGRIGRKFVRTVVLVERRFVEARWQATLLLQRMVRGLFGRRAARAIRTYLARRISAALLIQKAWYRRNNEYTTFFLLGCLREKDADEANEAATLHRLARHQHARTLQRYVKAFIQHRRHVLALRLQCAIRCYQARCTRTQLHSEHVMHRRLKWWFRVHHARRVRAATRLQFWWRKAVPGRMLRHLQTRKQRILREDARALREVRDAAATKIQALVHGAWTRAFVQKTRAAIAIQRIARGWRARRVVAALHRARRYRVASAFMRRVLVQAIERVTQTVMRTRGRHATTLQRCWRGCLCRQALVARWTRDALRQRMATRLQRIWRQNAQKRFAARLLTIQRRRVANPYKAFTDLMAIVAHAVESSLRHFDPFDPMVGLGLPGWLRRLGLESLYDDLLKLGCKSVASLRALSESQVTTLVRDKECRQTLLSALQYRTWLDDVRAQRRLLAERSVTFRRLDAPYTTAVARAAHQKGIVMSATERHKAATLEARDFKHPPRALRHRLETTAQQLRAATELLGTLEYERDRRAPGVMAAKEAMEAAKKTLKRMEEREVKAIFVQRSCLYIDSPEHIKRLFLDHFPNNEYRALSFVESLRAKPVTTCQLMTFFGLHATISDVKLHTPNLLYSKLDAEIAKAETNRLQACCDVLQFAVERMAELLAVSVIDMADAHASSSLPIAAALLQATHAAHMTKLPHRPMVWRQCMTRLLAMHTSAMAVASRLEHLRTHLQASYDADRVRKSVRRVWEDDVNAMQKVIAERSAAAAHAALLDELSLTLRFGYEADWHDQFQVWYYIHTPSGTMVWERPSYALAHHAACLKLQRASRRFLGRCRRQSYLRTQLRAAKKERERALWDPHWMDRQRSITLRIQASATRSPLTLQWTAAMAPSRSTRKVMPSSGVSIAPIAEAHYIVFASAYHRSVLREAKAALLLPSYARPPSQHASALVAMLLAYDKLRSALAPDRHTALTLAYTKVEMPFGWHTVDEPNSRTYYYNAMSAAVSWDAPEYVFEQEYAARAIQAAYHMFLGRKAFRKLLYSFSFAEHVHATIAAGATIAHVGFDLEGMSLSVYLHRLGLAKYAPSFAKAKHSIESFYLIPDTKLLSLYNVAWTKEDRVLLKAAPRPRPPMSLRVYPLTPRMLPIPEKHGFLCITSEKVLQATLAAHFTGQQGRVLSLVRAVRELPVPVSTKQLEMYIRLYSGRPQQATDNLSAELVPPQSTTEEKEVSLYKLYQSALKRCAVIAANMQLKHLARCLLSAIAISHCIHGVAHDPKLALTAVPLTPSQLATVVAVLPQTRGLWEPNIAATRKLSVGQAALYLRIGGLEFCLAYIRATILVQSTFRMLRLHRWYKALVAYRHRCAIVLQLAYRCMVARISRAWLVAEQASEYEEHYVEASQLSFYVYTPTQERLSRPPIDEYGRALPFRPLVLDRVSKKRILSWPWLASSNQAPEAVMSFESNVVCSLCKNERASRVCDVCCTSSGDYVYYCFACFCIGHPPALSWHTYQPLNHVHAAPLRCVECTRYSSHRCLDCKEDYCDKCYVRVHAKGSRSRHVVETYPTQALVCIECEERVAIKRCLVCQDALCMDCADRTHARGNKASHAMEPIVQPLHEGAGHCVACTARATDEVCRHCSKHVCTVCRLASKHVGACLETQLAAAKAALYGDNLCADCGKPADRKCMSCGDKYCSARWMGNPGCFERYHAKGKRVEHEVEPLPSLVTIEATAPILDLERKIAALRKAADDDAAADALARQRISEEQRLEAMRRDQAIMAEHKRQQQQESQPHVINSEKEKQKKAKDAPCGVPGCATPVFKSQLYCVDHCTVQLLLATGKDAAEVAKVMAAAQAQIARNKAEPNQFTNFLHDLREVSKQQRAAAASRADKN
ncbi:hypothetical protein SPRG_04951 [Saprolegnia parasitica CBS 223.65]|uniref:WW domain-containing protein n=1 Tax=Saprolegnia parasitica (strain CBS 223.65) TaxID=695850 RepID=A0A067CGK3_SAPPC|nr:hypothetical protein SPRG_04951 [Saprolegnia parasitica CBS 223.65]KDO29884.1 hypothetical protein SPRG_04951 [Saprolegnia parasitica CBS 223.65]|eukprot:XP_012199479.1 hypothetical protein SPRG_04951 [Saprolegnia parasitica CBS 223.65]